MSWSELPEDMVESISKKFTIYADYVRFRCVCRIWRLCTPISPLHLPTQFPWLALSYKSFFDLSSNKIHTLNLAPYSSGLTTNWGSSHGWLLIYDYQISELRLLNPITLAAISLSMVNIHNPIIKTILSSSPSLTDDFTAFSLHDCGRFAFYRKGSDSWVVHQYKVSDWVDVAYKNGCFYVVDRNGMIAVFDVVSLEISHIETTGVSSNVRGARYLVFLNEDMLLIHRIISYDRTKTAGYKVYKMNWNVRKWEQIQSLGQHSLFVSTKSSFSWCASDFVGYRPNCVYYPDDCGYASYVSLSDKSITYYPLPGDQVGIHFGFSQVHNEVRHNERTSHISRTCFC